MVPPRRAAHSRSVDIDPFVSIALSPSCPSKVASSNPKILWQMVEQDYQNEHSRGHLPLPHECAASDP